MFQTYSISSDQEDEFDGLNCNTILNTGLGLATDGLIITFLRPWRKRVQNFRGEDVGTWLGGGWDDVSGT